LGRGGFPLSLKKEHPSSLKLRGGEGFFALGREGGTKKEHSLQEGKEKTSLLPLRRPIPEEEEFPSGVGKEMAFLSLFPIKEG